MALCDSNVCAGRARCKYGLQRKESLRCDVRESWSCNRGERNSSAERFAFVVERGCGRVDVDSRYAESSYSRIDNQWTLTGDSQLSLSRGSHTIEVPENIEIDAGNRLRLDHWSNGPTSSNRTFALESDTTLKATYVMQHWLSIDSLVPLNGSGWYDDESTVSFSKPTSLPIRADLGILGADWAFDGWYEDGVYRGTSSTISIVMDAPHMLQLRWHQDYTIPIAILILALAALVATIIVKKRHRPN